MLTFFTTAKPFVGHAAVIQRNALKSWTLLHPDVEVILFGDDEGVAEVCSGLGIRHEPHVERNEYGTKRLDFIFDRAQEIAKHDNLCYLNCDIILLEGFCLALEHVKAAQSRYLMVGRRWDTDVPEQIDFSNSRWSSEIQQRALRSAQQRDVWWIDYFCFPRGLYREKIPALVIGRVYWDNWLIWYAKQSGAVVVDASQSVCVVHQNHDYGYHPLGKRGVWSDEQAQRNIQLAGGFSHLRTIANAHYRLTAEGLRRNPWHEAPYWREAAKHYWMRSVEVALNAWQNAVWHPLLNLTRPLRTKLGFRGDKLLSKPKTRD